MPKFKSILKRVEIETAKGQRTCRHKRRPIQKGDLCLIVLEEGFKRYCYSKEIALQMVTEAKRHLDQIEESLQSDLQQLESRAA